MGLSFIVEERFVALGGSAAEAGMLVLGVVALSTMVLEGIGPLSVKRSLQKAGEIPPDGDPFDPSEIRHIDMEQNGSCGYHPLVEKEDQADT